MVLDEEDGVEEDTEYIGLVDDAYSDADDGYDEEGEEEDNEEEYPGNSSVSGRKPWLKERSLYLPRTDWTAELKSLIRIELGLPLEEPGRYADKEFWGHDYWGDPSKMKDELQREKEPHSARTVGAVVEEEDDLVKGKEEDQEEVDELDRAESATVLQKVKEERGTVNGTATIRMDNIRGMFSRAAEEDDVLDVKNELGEQDKGDEGDDADEPSTNT
ncbi:unnamed protein product [Sphagnum jensenii]